MVGPPVERVRIVEQHGEGAPEVVRAVTSPAWARGAEVLKGTARSSVLAGEACGGRVVVKCVHLRGPWKRLAALVDRSRLHREWRGREMLAGLGLRVPRFLALVRGRDAAGRLVDALVMERIAGRTVLEAFAHRTLGVREQHALAELLGADVAHLHRHGLFNRDHKLSNVMVHRGEGGEHAVTYIDTSGVRRRGGGGGLEMLSKMLIEMKGVGRTPRAALRLRALMRYHRALHGDVDRERLRRDAREIERIIAAHGDATPEDDPLG